MSEAHIFGTHLPDRGKPPSGGTKRITERCSGIQEGDDPVHRYANFWDVGAPHPRRTGRVKLPCETGDCDANQPARMRCYSETGIGYTAPPSVAIRTKRPAQIDRDRQGLPPGTFRFRWDGHFPGSDREAGGRMSPFAGREPLSRSPPPPAPAGTRGGCWWPLGRGASAPARGPPGRGGRTPAAPAGGRGPGSVSPRRRAPPAGAPGAGSGRPGAGGQGRW